MTVAAARVPTAGAPRSASARSLTGAPARSRHTRPVEEVAPRPRLRVVRGVVPARTTLPFLLLVVLILAGALVSSMVLNAQMASTAYRMQQAQVELDVVNDHVATLQTQVQEASAPNSLAQRAAELGMVPAAAPGVIELSSGTVTGGTASAVK